jgi:mRNA-degrading endonuclease toxin of MazEF toxin-antitoxin module
MIHRGALHWAALDKRRPVLILSPNYRNELAADVIVVPCSTRRRAAPTHVSLRRGEGGAPEACMLYCEQIVTIPKVDVDPNPLGPMLAASRILEVERAVMRAIGIPILDPSS